jgi:hypothetical protein
VEGVYFVIEDWRGRWLGYGLDIGEYYILAFFKDLFCGRVWFK